MSAPAAIAAPPFRERLRRMRSKRNEDWWSIVFGGPVGTFLGALIAEVAWITPNRLTWLSFLFKLGAVPLIVAGGVDHPGADIIAMLMLQANAVLDCMDGSLARYRRRPSFLGGYLDKVTDAIGLLAVFGAAGMRVLHDHGDVGAMMVILAGAGGWITRCYAYWVVAYLEREHGVTKATVGPSKRQEFGELGFAARMKYYLLATPKIFNFAEADAYFWLGLALVFHDVRWFCWIFGCGMTLWSIGILVFRTITVARLDRSTTS